ncbi:MAG: hypothetical protein FWD52_08850 [Candidatus Bathyarchaeota archaeon]|nr:hypothetical protein [Candidatus Termiticorpusculum sp.]
MSATVFLVQGYNTGSSEALEEQLLSVNDSVPDINWDIVHKELAQNYTGSDFEGFFSEIKKNTEKNYNTNGESSNSNSNGSSTAESIPLQIPVESPAKGHWKQSGEYWNPIFEEMTPIYEWTPD